MSVELANEIWKLVRESIPYDDREQVADTLVGILVDYGIEPAEIRQEFTGDKEVLAALKYYGEDDATYDEDEYGTDSDGDEDW